MTIRQIFYLYRITNTINGKIYIGQSVDTNSRWRAHRRESAKHNPNSLISKAIKKYGNTAFEFEVVAACKTWEDANDAETLLIKQYNSQIPNGYNVAPGGINAPKTDEWKSKVSKKLMGHPVSDETRKKQSLAKVGKRISPATEFKKGNKLSEETKKKMSESRKGRKVSKETREKISKTLMGHLVSEGSRKKMSETHTKKIQEKKYSISKQDIVFIWDMIDRDFASMEKQNKADKILEGLANHFHGKTLGHLKYGRNWRGNP